MDLRIGAVRMHWRNKKEWTLWNDREIDGTIYSFEHLRSFDMPLVKEARGNLSEFKATIRVVFDCHVVTEKVNFIDHNNQANHYWRDTGGHLRKFDATRYKYSLNLPTLIGGLPGGKVKCYVGKHIGKFNNYMIWETTDGPGKAHYQAYFDIYKPVRSPSSDGPLLILYVQSAYLKNEPFAKQRERHKSFGQICAELVGVIPSKNISPKLRKKKQKPSKTKAFV